MYKRIVIVTLALLLTLAIAMPAFAQSLSLTTTYEMDGIINFEKQAGHKCNTGAEILQTIVGSGTMDKIQTISMIENRIMMEDDNNWVAGATPLTVTTVWDLCLPPKYIFSQDLKLPDEFPLFPRPRNSDPSIELKKINGNGIFVPISNQVVPLEMIYSPFFNMNMYVDLGIVEAVSDQIWAVQVQADPGFSGNLYQNGTAAHGGYADPLELIIPDGGLPSIQLNGLFGGALKYGYDNWRYDGIADKWTWVDDYYGIPAPTVGPDYVGNYFNMDQHARTSQGTLRRYIDISSPFSHAYVTEDMSVVGKSDIKDVLALSNLPAGDEIPGLWWDLF